MKALKRLLLLPAALVVLAGFSPVVSNAAAAPYFAGGCAQWVGDRGYANAHATIYGATWVYGRIHDAGYYGPWQWPPATKIASSSWNAIINYGDVYRWIEIQDAVANSNGWNYGSGAWVYAG